MRSLICGLLIRSLLIKNIIISPLFLLLKLFGTLLIHIIFCTLRLRLLQWIYEIVLSRWHDLSWQTRPWWYAAILMMVLLLTSNIFNVSKLVLSTCKIILCTSMLEVMRHCHHVVVSMSSPASLSSLSSQWSRLHSTNSSANIVSWRKSMLLSHSWNYMWILHWCKCCDTSLESTVNCKIMGGHKLSIDHQFLVFILSEYIVMSSIHIIPGHRAAVASRGITTCSNCGQKCIMHRRIRH